MSREGEWRNRKQEGIVRGLNEKKEANNRKAFMWAGTGISLLTLAARLLIRWKLLSKFKADDWLAMAAVAIFLVSTITYTAITPPKYVILGSLGRLGEDIGDMTEALAHSQLIVYICTWSCLWTIKLSFLAFFHGLGQQLRFQRILWWSTLALTLATYPVCIGLLDYKCLAASGETLMNELWGKSSSSLPRVCVEFRLGPSPPPRRPY